MKNLTHPTTPGPDCSLSAFYPDYELNNQKYQTEYAMFQTRGQGLLFPKNLIYNALGPLFNVLKPTWQHYVKYIDQT